MGEGHRIKDIATILSRSPKTIESHKEGIGRKLKVTDRAKFIEIAKNAGLDIDMVHRQRVEITCEESESPEPVLSEPGSPEPGSHEPVPPEPVPHKPDSQ